MLVLSKSDVMEAVRIADVITVVEEAQRLLGMGQAVSSTIYSLFDGTDPAILPEIHGNFQYFSAYVGGDMNAEGIASSASCVQNPEKFGLPYAVGLQLINDITTGVPLAVMERSRLTELVTPAFSAVGAKYLANDGPQTIAIIGCGNQGKTHLQAFNELFDIAAVTAFDMQAEVLDSYVAEMAADTGLTIEPAESAEQAIRAADIAAIAINPCKPIVRYDWIKPGAVIIALSGFGCELERADIYPRIDAVVIDSAENLEILRRETDIKSIVQLATLVAEGRTCRQDASEKIVLVHSGMAVNHVAAGQLVYRQATEKGLGTQVEML